MVFIVVSFWTLIDESVLVYNRLLPTANRPPAAARPSHARPRKQPSLSPAKERAPTPNSASGERQKEPSPVPDMAGDGKICKKHGNPTAMQQHNDD